MTVDPVPGKVLSLTEIMEGLSDLARNGEGAQKAAAYRMLLGANSTAATLPPPLSAQEIDTRLIRIMKMVGIHRVQASYRKAFPHATTRHRPLQINPADLELPADYKYPKTVRELYKMFPEYKRHGFPPGFPVGKGVLIQREWLKDMAIKILTMKMQKEEDEASRELRATDDAARGGVIQDAKDAPVTD